MLYTLKLHNVICQLYTNKARGEKTLKLGGKKRKNQEIKSGESLGF